MRLRAGVLLGMVLAAPAAAQDRPSDHGAWHLDTYGPARPQSPTDRLLLDEARKVFDKVKAVADKRLGRHPRLLAVHKPDAVEAHALPDGTIVINLPLLRFCFGASAERLEAGRARLAFVLGHEMAHLANDDSSHAETFAAVKKYGGERLREQTRPMAEEPATQRQEKELHADRAGFIFMTMAGFDPEHVLSAKEDFLGEWAARSSGPRRQGDHPGFRQRTSVLRARLAALAADLPFFRFGARLVQVGRPDDALPLLRHLSRNFPSREVETALGLAHYQRALARLRECGSAAALRFKLPVAVQVDTLAARIRLRDPGQPDCADSAAVGDELAAAEQALRSAVARDPAYVPARINLAALLVVRQTNPVEVLAVLRDEHARRAEDARLAVADAVAVYLTARELNVEMADTALQALDDLLARCPPTSTCEDDDAARAASFNRARMLQERGRGEAAQRAWDDFLRREPTGPFADEARAALLRAGVAVDLPPAETAPRPAQSLMARLSAGGRRHLAEARRRVFNLGDVRGAFLSAGPVQALELRGVVEMVEERLPQPRPLEAAQRELGKPLAVYQHAGGRTFVYHDRALDAEDGKVVREVLFQRN